MSQVERSDRERKLLARLLGSPKPEVSCDECFELLDRYAELQVSGADAEAALPGFRGHLENCPACREDYESLLSLLGS
jgi:hypothetical protein